MYCWFAAAWPWLAMLKASMQGNPDFQVTRAW